VTDGLYLLGDDVELLADLDADLHQHCAIMRTYALILGQLVAYDLAGNRRIDRLTATLCAFVSGHIDGVAFVSSFFNSRLCCSAQILGFVENRLF